MPNIRLKTQRLTLRSLEESDWPALYAYDSNPEVVRHLVWGPNRPADTMAFASRAAAESRKSGPVFSYKLAVVLSGTDLVIGNCNLFLKGLYSKEASIEFFFHPAYWGQGFGAETAAELLRFGFKDLELHRITAQCRTENAPGLRVLEKVGMRREGHFRKHEFARGEWSDIYLFATLESEWQQARSRAVIFDMDGVLVDTEPIYLQANQEVFQRLGITVSQDEYNRFIGVTAEHMWSELKQAHHLAEPVPVLIRREANASARKLMEMDLVPMPGVVGLIERLDKEGIPMAVASSSSHRVIRIILSKTGLVDKFMAITSGDDVVNGKPAPDIFLTAAARLGVPPDRCIVIEDSSHGLKGARAAGMRTVGFIGDHASGQDLSTADLVLHGYADNSFDRINALFPEQPDPTG